jgi:hypothetical protein
VLALLAEDLADVGDVLTATDKRREDHVDVVLDAEAQVVLVLLGQGGQVDIRVGQVDALAGRDEAVVAGADLDGLLIDDLEDLEGEDTIVDVDDTAGLDDLCDVLVVDVAGAVVSLGVARWRGKAGWYLHVVRVAGGGVLLVGGEVEDLAGGEGQVGVVLGVAGTDLGALGVEGDGDLTARLGLLGGAGVVNDGLVILVAAVLREGLA